MAQACESSSRRRWPACLCIVSGNQPFVITFLIDIAFFFIYFFHFVHSSDNIRFLCTGMVVASHALFWAKLWFPGYPDSVHLYLFLQPVIMPTFSFISGYFSKSFGILEPAQVQGAATESSEEEEESQGDENMRPKEEPPESNYVVKIPEGKIWNNFATLIIPYFLFHILLIVREYHLLWLTHENNGTPMNFNRFIHRAFSAKGTMFTFLDQIDEAWYLLALFFWRLSVPYIRLVKYPLLASWLSYLLSYSFHFCESVAFVRIFQYYPFFVAGLLMTDEHVNILRNRIVQIVSLFFFRLLWHLCRPNHQRITTDVHTPELDPFPSQQPSILFLLYYHPLGLICSAAACALSLGVLDFRNIVTEPYSLMTLFNYLLHYHPAMVLIGHFGCLNIGENRVDSSKPNLVGPAVDWSGAKVSSLVLSFFVAVIFCFFRIAAIVVFLRLFFFFCHAQVTHGFVTFSIVVSFVMSGKICYFLFSPILNPNLSFMRGDTRKSSLKASGLQSR
jgi:fucose 4-O-acetylase-like acetyltransferase